MKYKNIVFDFGNVIGKFNGRDLVKHFSSCEEDQELLFTAIFSRWDDIDNGSVDYEQNIDNIAASLPDRLESAVRTLFREWPRHLTPINDTLRFIDELKERNIPLYLFGFYVFQISDTFRFCFFLLFRARSKQFCHHCNDSSCCDKEIREIICDPFQMFIFQAKSHIIYNVSANEPIEHITDRACRHQ